MLVKRFVLILILSTTCELSWQAPAWAQRRQSDSPVFGNPSIRGFRTIRIRAQRGSSTLGYFRRYSTGIDSLASRPRRTSPNPLGVNLRAGGRATPQFGGRPRFDLRLIPPRALGLRVRSQRTNSRIGRQGATPLSPLRQSPPVRIENIRIPTPPPPRVSTHRQGLIDFNANRSTVDRSQFSSNWLHGSRLARLGSFLPLSGPTSSDRTEPRRVGALSRRLTFGRAGSGRRTDLMNRPRSRGRGSVFGSGSNRLRASQGPLGR